MGQSQSKVASNEDEIAAKALEDDEPDDWYRFVAPRNGVSCINLLAGTNGSSAPGARVGSASVYLGITN